MTVIILMISGIILFTAGLINWGIEFASGSQLLRYQKFKENRNIPVFIVIGVSGKPDSRQYFYVVPLAELKSNFSINIFG